MQEPLKTKRQMVGMSPQAFILCNQYVMDTGNPADAYRFLYATTNMVNLCKVIVDDGKICCILFPDTVRNDDADILEIHAIITPHALKGRRDQLRFFKQYISLIFNQFSYNKIVVKVAEPKRLIQYLAEQVGFTLEGTLRKEYDGTQSMLYYGLFKEEYNGRQ